ncbi:hypothetical protein ABIE45_002826 [Methylobacterium sp. OAE515]|uniref:hypothetical protein n=1 Tax=Methylobacterium sp. OAE515 TaxID=2817895 RepID=UPI00178979BA
MTKSWPLLALAVLGAVAVVFCLAAFDWITWACRLPVGEEGKVLTPGFGGCIEFWLNRYQTSIGAVAALIAGFAAWQGAMKQVARADAQIVLINKQTAIDRIQYINERLKPVEDLIYNINGIKTWLNSAIDAMPVLREAAFDISKAAEAEDWSHIQIHANQYEPILKDADDKIAVAKRMIDAMHAIARDATLPESIRDDLRKTIFNIVETYNMTVRVIPVFKSNLGINSSFDSVRREYSRIHDRAITSPRRIELEDYPLHMAIVAEQKKLLTLRVAAEAIADT